MNAVTPADDTNFVTQADTSHFVTPADDTNFVTQADTSHFVTQADDTNFVTQADTSHFVTPANAGVQIVFLVSGFHRNDDEGFSPE